MFAIQPVPTMCVCVPVDSGSFDWFLDTTNRFHSFVDMYPRVSLGGAERDGGGGVIFALGGRGPWRAQRQVSDAYTGYNMP